MVCVPMLNEFVLKLVRPLVRVPVPKAVLPSRNVTVPVGGFPMPPFTVALKITVSPKLELELELDRVVVVGVIVPMGTMVRVTGDEVEPRNWVLPSNLAVMLKVPVWE